MYDSDISERERGREQPRGPAHEEPPPEGLQLPVKTPLPARAWRLDEKPWLLGQTGALDFSQRPLKAKLAYCPRPRPLTQTTRASAPQILTTPARRKTAAIFARAAAHTAKRQLLAEGVAAAMRRRRARAAHIARDHRGSETTHKHGRQRTNNQTSPTAFNRLTRQNAQALFRTKQGNHVQAETVTTASTPRAGVPRYSLRSSAKTRTTVIRAAGSV